MSVADPAAPDLPRPTVFLSYASEDRSAAQALRDALPLCGLEVWYDESDLIGGDAWDQKIRRQIRECDYFMPVISAHTEARHEGYFRREWRLAVERTLDMADDHIFLVPVVIDQTVQSSARVPEKFLAVQWLRVPDGHSTPALEALCQRLVSGQSPALPAQKNSLERPAAPRSQAPPRAFPEFPREEPGQKIRYGAQVLGWSFQSAWIAFQRLPKWLRIVIYLWVAVLLLARGCSSPDHHASPITSEQAKKLAQISDSTPQDWSNKDDVANFVAQITQAVPGAAKDALAGRSALLAIPFDAPSGDPLAQKLAGSAFAQVYGRIAIARHGHVGLTEPPASLNSATAAGLGRAHHSSYVIYGAVEGASAAEVLRVNVVDVADGSIKWSESYPVAGADPARIAADVISNLPSTEDD
jgi:TolB-like protein